MIYSLPHDKILDQTKLKAFADDKLNVTKKTIFVFDRVENIVKKGEMKLLVQCFQKASSPDPSKGVIVWEWLLKKISNQNLSFAL